MTLLHEIHSQPRHVRTALWLLSSFLVLGVIGYFWLSGLERELFFALHDNSAERAQFVASQDARVPHPLAAIGSAFGSLGASIGSLFGIDSTKGFDSRPQSDTIYPLPLSR
ncbi:MAG TPA: hypothetical protein VMJ72_02900 [Candidatus Paceibacterota bacterium]|nr:hypothetical protein [Candidatus Paceibacterota bacterium]